MARVRSFTPSTAVPKRIKTPLKARATSWS